MRISGCDAVRFWFVVLTASLAWLSAPWAIASTPPEREHVLLPPAFVGTPLSLQIHAEAAYLAARGDLAESVAIARRIHADAVAQEIQNSVDAVDAYFRRRELNRQWREKENPNYLQQEEHLQEVRRKRLEEQYQDVLKSDLTGMLNWLLVELSGPTLAYQYVSGELSLTDSELDRKLPPEDMKQIQLSEAGGSGGRLVFSVVEAKALQTRWPPALRQEKFDTMRTAFETTRDALLDEIRRDGRAKLETGEKLVKCANDMLVALEEAYPPDQRKDIDVFLLYNSAKRYVRSLAAQSQRALRTNDSALFNGSLHFEGDSLVDLIQHMDRNGLVFAAPEPGGERVYRTLMDGMRDIYISLVE